VTSIKLLHVSAPECHPQEGCWNKRRRVQGRSVPTWTCRTRTPLNSLSISCIGSVLYPDTS